MKLAISFCARNVVMKAKFVKPSICSCGYPSLNESVPIGTIYEVNPEKWEYIVWICGGCKKQKHEVKVIWVHERVIGERVSMAGVRVKEVSAAGYLPEEIFQIGPEVPSQAQRC